MSKDGRIIHCEFKLMESTAPLNNKHKKWVLWVCYNTFFLLLTAAVGSDQYSACLVCLFHGDILKHLSHENLFAKYKCNIHLTYATLE